MIQTKVRTLGLSILLGCLVTLPSFAQYIPPNGTSYYDALSSPLFLGGAGTVTGEEPPLSDSLNPATSGTRQRTTLDLSYINLVGLGDESGAGHIINTGITIPTRAGVFSGSGRFLSSTYDSVDLGSVGALNLSFSKDLYPNLMVGAGLGFTYGSQESTDWGLGLDLGFLHYAHDRGFLKDLRWGGSLRNLGKGLKPDPDRDAYPAPFTPALGAQATVVRSETVSVGLTSDVSLPAVQDLRLGVGTEVGILDTVFLRTGYVFDLVENNQSELPTASFPLSFGATVKLKTAVKEDNFFVTERGWNRSELRINMSATPLPGDIWAVGLGVNIPLGVRDNSPPAIDAESADVVYISPDLDGTQDDLELPVEIGDERFVKGYQLVIKDESGQVVRTIQNKDERPENVTFKNIMDRLLYVKAGVPIPESLRWDGRTDQAEPVADARYSYTIEAWDDNGNAGEIAARTVIVDSTPPAAEIAAPYLIFSPNEDGNKDTLVIDQEGSTEDRWDGSVSGTDGKIVARFSWDTQAPPTFEWDGKMTDGILAPDGVYSYGLESIDRAGNRTTTALRGIIINTQATPIDLRVDRSFFSPNSDGVKDVINLMPDVPVLAGIESWQLRIQDDSGLDRRTYQGEGSEGIADVIIFDGQGNDGESLPEGRYSAVMDLAYINGNHPTATSPQFSIDLTRPAVTTRADLDIFSPNGDGRKDTVTLYQETSQEVGWAGLLSDATGQPVLRFFWRGEADSPLVWDGRGADGLLLPDGEYIYVLQTSDRAGNDAQSTPVKIALDTEETPVLVNTDIIAFSPNGDGINDRIKIRTQLKDQDRIDRHTLTIVDANDQVVRTVGGRGAAPESVDWDGRGDDGTPLPDGEYHARLEVVYAKGNQPVVSSNAFVVDTEAPRITAVASRTLFSPNGDGNKDTVTLSQNSTPESLWEGVVLAPDGNTVRQYFWKGGTEDIKWDGTDDNGNRAEDGVYSYVVSSQDAAGNRTEQVVSGIRIDTRPTPVFVTANDDGFSPNGDDFRDTVRFNMYVNQSQEIESWQLDMVHEIDGVMETFSGLTDVPDTLTWDGSDAPEGAYRGRFTVRYLKGNIPESTTSEFRLDVSAPEVALSATPQPFSPDNDGLDDEVTIGLGVSDLSPIDAWILEILDPKGNSFARFAGTGTPSPRILWDGLSVGGELVQAAEDYSMIVTISDVLGNVATEQGAIPVDVLVIRDGDKLKIQISSITFAPNTADYLGVDEAKAEKNLKTLKRLVEIFRKYRSYSIRIEGHAVNVNWANPTLAAREEQEELLPLSTARAEAVKEGLVALGMDPDRITTAGLGGKHPVVPHGDLDNRWKSRRVEFILVRER